MKTLAKTFVSFRLNNQGYALSCSKVHRILRAVEVRALPNEAKNIAGVVNIHGKIVPVINLRRMLEIKPKEMTLEDTIIVAEDNKNFCSFVVEETNFMEVLGHNIVSMKDIMKDVMKNDSKVEMNKKGKSYIKGIIKDAEGPIYILNLKKIWQEIGKEVHEL